MMMVAKADGGDDVDTDEEDDDSKASRPGR